MPAWQFQQSLPFLLVVYACYCSPAWHSCLRSSPTPTLAILVPANTCYSRPCQHLLFFGSLALAILWLTCTCYLCAYLCLLSVHLILCSRLLLLISHPLILHSLISHPLILCLLIPPTGHLSSDLALNTCSQHSYLLILYSPHTNWSCACWSCTKCLSYWFHAQHPLTDATFQCSTHLSCAQHPHKHSNPLFLCWISSLHLLFINPTLVIVWHLPFIKQTSYLTHIP